MGQPVSWTGYGSPCIVEMDFLYHGYRPVSIHPTDAPACVLCKDQPVSTIRILKQFWIWSNMYSEQGPNCILNMNQPVSCILITHCSGPGYWVTYMLPEDQSVLWRWTSLYPRFWPPVFRTCTCLASVYEPVLSWIWAIRCPWHSPACIIDIGQLLFWISTRQCPG
jgi:hypothetical protein